MTEPPNPADGPDEPAGSGSRSLPVDPATRRSLESLANAAVNMVDTTAVRTAIAAAVDAQLGPVVAQAQKLVAAQVSDVLADAHRLVARQLQPTLEQFAAQWATQAESIRRQMAAFLDNPEFRRTLESLQRIAETYLPANWRGHRISFDRAWQVAADEGLPLVWVPRGELVVALLDLEDTEARWALLAERAADIVDDCASVTATVTLPELAEHRERLEQVIAAHRDGHPEAAQALAAVVFTSLLQYAYGHGKLVNVKKSPLRATGGDPSELSIRLYKGALLIEAAQPAVDSIGDLVPEDQWGRFNRNLTLHRVSRQQYTDAHAVAAIMLATALLAEAQALVECGVLAPASAPSD